MHAKHAIKKIIICQDNPMHPVGKQIFRKRTIKTLQNIFFLPHFLKKCIIMSFACRKPQMIPCNMLDIWRNIKCSQKVHIVTVESGNDFSGMSHTNLCWSCFEVLGIGFSACRTHDLLYCIIKLQFFPQTCKELKYSFALRSPIITCFIY